MIDRWYRPARPELDAARAVVGACRDPRDAWDALSASAVVPAAWRDDPRRWFWITRLEASRCEGGVHQRHLCEVPGTEPSHVRAWPMTVRAAIGFAADAEAVMTAERLAREVAARLAPWDSDYEAAPPSAVVWREIEPAAPRGDNLELAWEVAGVIRAQAWPLLSAEERAARTAWPRPLPWPLAYLVDAAADWQRLVAIDAGVPARRSDHPMRRPRAIRLAGRRFAELASPFEPMVDIFALGYGLAAITADAIGLYAPRLG